MNTNISMLFKKYSVPAMFSIMGLLIIIIGISKDQDAMFMAASILMFGAAAISMLYSTGKLTTKLTYIIGIVSGIAAAFTIWMSYVSVTSTMRYNENYKQCRTLAIQNLQDIRLVQKKHKEKYGNYIGDWDKFVDFVKNGYINQTISKGSVPDTFPTREEYTYLGHKQSDAINNKLTVMEAHLLSKWKEGPRYERMFSSFVRDTQDVSVIKALFSSDSYKRSREIAGFHNFSADSLPYIPFTGAREMWSLEVKDSVQMGDLYVPAIHVEGTIPFAKMQGKSNEKLSFGTLTSGDDTGSWEQ